MSKVFFIGGSTDRTWRNVEEYNPTQFRFNHDEYSYDEATHIEYTTETYVRKFIGEIEIAYFSEITLEDAIMDLINAYEEH